jgi:hypothetical protein
MKKFTLLFSIPLLAFLFGCPIGIMYAPGNPGTEKIDKDLIGTWQTTTEDPEFAIATITKQDDYSLHASLSNTGGLFDLKETELTCWNTVIDGLKIIYTTSDGKYYSYAYKMDNNALTLFDVSLLEGGIDAVTSTETFRSQISASMKNHPDYLKEGKLYTKK